MFQIARPVWAENAEKEVNLHLLFTLTLPQGAALVRMTASTAYHLYLDGAFVSYGPARAGDGYFRVDEWPLHGETKLQVHVAGYYSSSFQYSLYRSFLTLEVLSADGAVLFATGRDEIDCRPVGNLLRFTDKMARQRLYTEVYDFSRENGAPLKTAVYPHPKYLPRRVKPFSNTVYTPVSVLADFTVQKGECPPEKLKNGRSPFNNNKYMNPEVPAIFAKEDCNLFKEAMGLTFCNRKEPASGVLKAGQSRLFAFDANRTGLLGADVTVSSDCEVYFVYDEILTNGDVTPLRSACLTAVKASFPRGSHRMLTFEPYTMKYLKVCVTRGEVTLDRLFLCEQAGAACKELRFEQPLNQLIYDAAVNTFRPNATDIFMDCPSRERAGWLCDSFFTARSEYALTGENPVETNFLENFACHDGIYMDEEAPEGMVPMLYPGSTEYVYGGKWIANWAMWLILEIEEYARLRRGDAALVQALRPVVYGILNSFQKSENEYGLLENLPGWVFVDTSRSNGEDVVCGVNFPTNMLYTAVLKAAAALYGESELADRAEKLQKQIRAFSYNGTFFADNAVRRDGKLVPTQNTTEACQYYAFLFDTADETHYPDLAKILREDFGPRRSTYPEVPPADTFIGVYLRLCMLMKMGACRQIPGEMQQYFGYMARQSNTLWEHVDAGASCCHGFASYAAVLLAELKEKYPEL